MKPPKCSFCSVMEWRHVCGGAINKAAINSAINKIPAINRREVSVAVRVQAEGLANAGVPTTGSAARKIRLRPEAQMAVRLAAGAEHPRVPGEKLPQGRSPNRRLREDYNAYMREYMRKRRAK